MAPNKTEARDESARSAGDRAQDAGSESVPAAEPTRRPYSSPRLRPLGRVAELMRGSAGGTTDGHTSKKKP